MSIRLPAQPSYSCFTTRGSQPSLMTQNVLQTSTGILQVPDVKLVGGRAPKGLQSALWTTMTARSVTRHCAISVQTVQTYDVPRAKVARL